MTSRPGAVAQLVAHHTGSVGVRGSSPLSSTPLTCKFICRSPVYWVFCPPGPHRVRTGRCCHAAKGSSRPREALSGPRPVAGLAGRTVAYGYGFGISEPAAIPPEDGDPACRAPCQHVRATECGRRDDLVYVLGCGSSGGRRRGLVSRAFPVAGRERVAWRGSETVVRKTFRWPSGTSSPGPKAMRRGIGHPVACRAEKSQVSAMSISLHGSRTRRRPIGRWSIGARRVRVPRRSRRAAAGKVREASRRHQASPCWVQITQE